MSTPALVGAPAVRVFISYTSRDSSGVTAAERLESLLLARSLTVWRDRSRLHGGDLWSTAIQDALDECDVLLALISPSYGRSEMCQAEFITALNRGCRVIPVIVDGAAVMPYPLRARNFVRSDDELLLAIESPDEAAAMPDTAITRSGVARRALTDDERTQLARHLHDERLRLATELGIDLDRLVPLPCAPATETASGRRWSTPPRQTTTSALWHETRERLLLLQGGPGSGKTACLLKSAADADRHGTALPIYVDLRQLIRPPGREIDGSLIRFHVLRYLGRENATGVRELLAATFDEELTAGRWIFFFDAFDEIPEVAASSDFDGLIRQYLAAIRAFMGGLNRCRAIVTSRGFSLQRPSGLPHYNLLPLSTPDRTALVVAAGLEPDRRDRVLAALSGLDDAIVDTPLLVSLWCRIDDPSKVRPTTVHEMIGVLVRERLAVAEKSATTAAALSNDGASAAASLRSNAESIAMRLIEENASDVPFDLDMSHELLVGARLGRRTIVEGEPRFSFAHRRILDYFATCGVLRRLPDIDAACLVGNAGWREVVISILQINCDDARALVAELQNRVLLSDKALRAPLAALPVQFKRIDDEERAIAQYGEFTWPPNALYVLALLEEGLRGRTGTLDGETQAAITRILATAAAYGTPEQRAHAVRLCSLLEQGQRVELVRRAFATCSVTAKDAAFWQVDRLEAIPEDVNQSVKALLLVQAIDGMLRSRLRVIQEYLAHVPGAWHDYLGRVQTVPVIDRVLLGLLFAAILIMSAGSAEPLALAGCSAMWLLLIVRGLGLANQSWRTDPHLAGAGGPFLLDVYLRIAILAYSVELVGPLPFGEYETVGQLAMAYVAIWGPSAADAAVVPRFQKWIWLPFLPVVEAIVAILYFIPLAFSRLLPRFVYLPFTFLLPPETRAAFFALAVFLFATFCCLIVMLPTAALFFWNVPAAIAVVIAGLALVRIMARGLFGLAVAAVVTVPIGFALYFLVNPLLSLPTVRESPWLSDIDVETSVVLAFAAALGIVTGLRRWLDSRPRQTFWLDERGLFPGDGFDVVVVSLLRNGAMQTWWLLRTNLSRSPLRPDQFTRLVHDLCPVIYNDLPIMMDGTLWGFFYYDEALARTLRRVRDRGLAPSDPAVVETLEQLRHDLRRHGASDGDVHDQALLLLEELSPRSQAIEGVSRTPLVSMPDEAMTPGKP